MLTGRLHLNYSPRKSRYYPPMITRMIVGVLNHQLAFKNGHHLLCSTLSKASISVFLRVFVNCACIAMAGEVHAASVNGTLVGEPLGAFSFPSPAKTVDRPPSLPEPGANDDTLRSYASRIGLYFGSMIDSNDEGWETAWVRNTLSSEFNMMVPGTQLKWATIHPSKDRFYFEPGDALVEFASAHNMKVRGVILLWGMWKSRLAR